MGCYSFFPSGTLFVVNQALIQAKCTNKKRLSAANIVFRQMTVVTAVHKVTPSSLAGSCLITRAIKSESKVLTSCKDYGSRLKLFVFFNYTTENTRSALFVALIYATIVRALFTFTRLNRQEKRKTTKFTRKAVTIERSSVAQLRPRSPGKRTKRKRLHPCLKEKIALLPRYPAEYYVNPVI